jgi:hypothetical protein
LHASVKDLDIAEGKSEHIASALNFVFHVEFLPINFQKDIILESGHQFDVIFFENAGHFVSQLMSEFSSVSAVDYERVSEVFFLGKLFCIFWTDYEHGRVCSTENEGCDVLNWDVLRLIPFGVVEAESCFC